MHWIKRLTLAASLLLPAPAMATDADDLAALLRANSWAVQVGAHGLEGPGGAKVEAWADEAQFFLLGEDHGSAGLARFARGLSDSLARHNYRYTAVEVDPLMTGILVDRLRAGKPALAAYLTDGRQQSIPFYALDEEADFILSAMRRGPVWGLDQSFIAAAPIHFEAIAAQSRSATVRAMASALAKDARADMQFLGSVDPARLEALRSAMPANENSEARTIADRLIASAAIYAPFVTRTGSTYPANLRRETEMKQLLAADIDAAIRRDHAPPKILFKFGANHLARGLSPTHVPSLGNFAAENALGRFGKPAFNLVMLCGPGGGQVAFDGSSEACDKGFDGLFGALRPYLVNQGSTIFDLRPLRSRPKLWSSWPDEAKALIWSYDALAVITGGGPSHYLVPPAKP